MKKAAQRLVITGLLLFSVSNLIPVHAYSTEYLCLTVNGDSMYPAIRDGDTVKVKLRVNGSSVKVGDIIVYCTIAAIAYNPRPKAMFIGHRVIRKYVKDGTWHFKTKGDNSAEADPWEVPQHFLLGVVVDVVHTNRQTEPSTAPQQYSDRSAVSTVPDDLFLGLVIGLLVGFVVSKCGKQASESFSHHRKRMP